MSEYAQFLLKKTQHGTDSGFGPKWMPEFLFDFQSSLVEWSLRRGRSAIFADCGLGKSPMSLTWAENVVRHTNKPVLIVTPLAVSLQLLHEAEKFQIDCRRSSDGKITSPARVIVTNYERLHLFDSSQFSGLVCDESSILKNFDGARRATVTEFLRVLPYRLLCTATAAPNDYIELGTSAEALGELGHMDMLARFFKNDQNSINANRIWEGAKWRFKHHAEQPFWKWVCSWARAIRRPSDLGFDDGRFTLPPLAENEHIISTTKARDGWLPGLSVPAVGLREEREERRLTIEERCEMAAKLADHNKQVLVWCHLNDEANLLERLIPGAIQVSGSDDDEAKEEKLMLFADGKVRALVTKPKIGAWGLNLQNCAHIVSFATHSFEQHYQGVRRCWRFGQQRPVTVDIVATEGERNVIANLRRKGDAADRMFSSLVHHMNDAMHVGRRNDFTKKEKVPTWLLQTNT